MTPTLPGTKTFLANSGVPPSQPAAAMPGLIIPIEPALAHPFLFAYATIREYHRTRSGATKILSGIDGFEKASLSAGPERKSLASIGPFSLTACNHIKDRDPEIFSPPFRV
jgi:hypothetical protein